jgi:hypothetical protein
MLKGHQNITHKVCGRVGADERVMHDAAAVGNARLVSDTSCTWTKSRMDPCAIGMDHRTCLVRVEK